MVFSYALPFSFSPNSSRVGKQGLAWKGEKYFYLVCVICRFLLTADCPCGGPPRAGSFVGCCEVCCALHVGSAQCVNRCDRQLTSSSPSSTIFCPCDILHSPLQPIKTAQAWLPSCIHWNCGKHVLLVMSSSGYFCGSYLSSCRQPHSPHSPVGGRHQSLCSHMPLNSRSSSWEQFHRILLQRPKNLCSIASLQLGREILLGAELGSPNIYVLIF